MNEGEETPLLLARKPLRQEKEEEEKEVRGRLEYRGSETEGEEEEEEELPGTQPLDHRPLAGVMVYVDVRSGQDSCENRSEAVSHQLDALGATICCRLTKDITHVVFKDGKPATREKAEKKGFFLVSPLWVEACKRANDRVSEAKYPVLSREGAGGSPVVLGRIKRFKSLQPKPLEVEIARSLEHSRKRQRVKAVARGAENTTPPKKSKLVAAGSKSAQKKEEEEEEEARVDGYSLPAVRLLPRTPGEGGSSPSLAVTPDVATSSSAAGKKTAQQKLKTLAPLNATGSAKKKTTGVLQKKNESKHAHSKLKNQTADGKENLSIEEKGAGSSKRRKTRNLRGRVFHKERPTLVCTSVEPQDQELVYSIIEQLGVFEASKTVSLPSSSSSSSTTHLVCGCPGRRTVNVLAASLLGCWVVGLDWVWRSLEAGRWLEEEPFELSSNFPAAQYYRLERLQRPGVPYQPSLFSGVGSVFVATSSHPPPSQLELLLTLGGAKLTSSHRKADVCVGCKARSEEVKSISEQWILDSISEHRQLPLEDYLLDSDLSRAASPEL